MRTVTITHIVVIALHMHLTQSPPSRTRCKQHANSHPGLSHNLCHRCQSLPLCVRDVSVTSR